MEVNLKMIGIYKITNLQNGQSYIGQSIRIEQRWADEKRRAFVESDKAYNYPLSRAFRKYGIDNFSFEIIEECQPSQLDEREKYWIAYYNTFYNGYNQTLGGDNPITKPKDSIIGIINDLETTDMYHKEIASKWNISVEMVQGINTGRYWYQENKTYPLQTKHKSNSQHKSSNRTALDKKEYFCAKCHGPITAKAELCVACARLQSRKVERPTATDLYNYLIEIKGNFSAASRFYGVSDNAIRKWCKSYGIPASSTEYKKITSQESS